MSVGGDHWIHPVLQWLLQSGQDDASGVANAAPAAEIQPLISSLAPAELEAVLGVLEAQDDFLLSTPGFKLLAQWIASRSLELSRSPSHENGNTIDAELLATLYRRLESLDQSESAAHIMQTLAGQLDPASLETLAELLIDVPPQRWQLAGLGLSPLWRASTDQLEEFFEQLRECELEPSCFCVVMDLANYAVREARLDEHPWRDRSEQLKRMLESILGHLRKLEREPQAFGNSVTEVQQILGDSLAMTVSLCDALGLIGDRSASRVLGEALELSHRRIQTEAAGALAALGDERGKQRLIQLAGDPVSRMRAVHYARELEMTDALEASLQTPQALAESELAAWLAAPEQFALPPTEMELIDTRIQYWPGYDEPQECFLFRYSYHLPDRHLSNVGIVGPLTKSFTADLANLPVDDIYAAFAGWQAEHEEIYEVPAHQFNSAQRREAERLSQWLEDQQFEDIDSIAMTFFLGEFALLCHARQDERQLGVITDGQELLSYPISEHPASLSPEIILCIFRGRKLLRTFNP